MMKNWVSIRLRNLQNYLLTPNGGALMASLVALLILLLAWSQASRWYQARLLAESRSQAAVEVSLRANTLLSALNRRMVLLDGLYAYVLAESYHPAFEEKFQTFATQLYSRTTGIRNIAVAPGGVVRYVYPLAGNENVIGYDPLLDPRPSVRDGVQRTLDSREVVLTGPVELLQGEVGLIARQAVYKDGAYWGLVNIAVDLKTVIDRAGLSDHASGLDLALRNDSGFVFFGSDRVFEDDPVFSVVDLPEGSWTLAGVPEGGWVASISGELAVFQSAGLLIILLLVSLVYLSTNRQAWLSQAVWERTQEIREVNKRLQRDIAERRKAEAALSEREEQYRSIFESVSDGLFINDLNGRLVDFNPAAYRMHGYTEEEFRQLQPAQFIHPESMPLFQKYMDTVKAGMQYRGRAIDLRKDGTPFHVEVLGTYFKYRGQPHSLAILRDITDEVQAFQLLEQRVEARTRELSTLLEVSRTVASTLELKTLLSLVLDQLKPVVDYANAAMFLSQNGEDGLVLLEQRSLKAPGPEQPFIQPPVQFTSTILKEGRPMIIQDAQGEISADLISGKPWSMASSEDGASMASWMAVPLLLKDRVTGMLVLAHEQANYYTSRHADLAMAFANQASVAIENARLYAQAQELAALQERQKLARELHDSVSQALYGIGLGVRTARALLEHDPAKAIDPLDYALNLTEAGLTEMRALIFELRPESIETEGLVPALTRQAAALRARQQIEVSTSLEEEPQLSLETKQALYRIAQEALHNIVKHARATQVELRMFNQDDCLLLEVKDNGVGFDSQASFPGHLGLQSMRERTERMGGSLHIESVPGQGTLIRAQIPLT